MDNASKVNFFRRKIMFYVGCVLMSIGLIGVKYNYAQAASKIKTVKVFIDNKNVTKKNKTIGIGDKINLKIKVKPSSAKKKITFKSNDKKIATVSKKGVVIGKSEGTTKINISVKGKNNKNKNTYMKIVVKKDSDCESKIQVGIILPTKDDSRWLQDQKQFETILGDAGFSYQVVFSQGSSSTEKTNVETLISKGIKVLIICPQDGAAAAFAAREARDAGVKVISYDRLITGTDAVDYYVTFDSKAVGAAQGQYLIDNAPEGSDIPLYLFAGAATDNNAFIFFEGAWKVLQPKIADGTFKIANSTEAEALKDKAVLSREDIGKIIGQITTDWDFKVAKSKAEANLKAVGTDMKGNVLILAPNDGVARSIADVFASDKDVKSYVITGQDSEKASVQYIIDGKQSMTVFKDTRTLAADSVAMAVDILDGKEPATDSTYNNESIDVPAKQTAIIVVTKDNIKEALVDSGYYEISDFTGLK